MEKVTYDFDALAQAKIKQDEFALLTKVSRITVNGWINGKPVHPARSALLRTYLRIFRSALDIGILPLRHGMPRDQRLDVLKSILRDHLAAKK